MLSQDFLYQFHLDYCFASELIMRSGFDILIGKVDEWIEFSDHTPIIVLINKIDQKKIVNSLAKGLEIKFERLSPITKEKFGKLIDKIINQAKLSDKNNSIEKDNIERIKIIDDAEKIMKINELIGQINRFC